MRRLHFLPEHDKWSKWLVETCFGGDEKIAEAGLKAQSGRRRQADSRTPS
jgi:hypothetical protein